MSERKKHPLSTNPTTDAELLAQCNEHLYYDPETGVFQWKKKAGKKTVVGNEAGSVHNGGYLSIRLHGHLYLAHSLAFLMTHGYLPEWPDQVDHVDHVRDHNWADNIRHATSPQNMYNTGSTTGSKSKYKGVSPSKNKKRWMVFIGNKIMGNRNFGTFTCEHYAARVWNTAARIHQGYEFCYTNKVDYCNCGECT